MQPCRGLLGDRARVRVYDPVLSERQIRRDTVAKVHVARESSDADTEGHGGEGAWRGTRTRPPTLRARSGSAS